MTLSWARLFLIGVELGAITGFGLLLGLAAYAYLFQADGTATLLISYPAWAAGGVTLVALLTGAIVARNARTRGDAVGSAAAGAFLGGVIFLGFGIATLLAVARIAPGPDDTAAPEAFDTNDYVGLAKTLALAVPAAVAALLAALALFVRPMFGTPDTKHAPTPPTASTPSPAPPAAPTAAAPPPAAPPAPSPVPAPAPPAGAPAAAPPGATLAAAPVATLTCPRCRTLVPAYRGAPMVSCPNCQFTGPNPVA